MVLSDLGRARPVGSVEKPYLGFIPSSHRLREANGRISSWPAIRARHASYLIPHFLMNASTGNIRFSPPFSFFTPRLNGSGVIYYEYEKHEKFEDYDDKANAELGTFKIRHYHFDDESFVHPLHNVRFDPDHPYEVPIEALIADRSLGSSENGKTSTRGSHPSRRLSPAPHYSPRGLSLSQQVLSSSKAASSLQFVIE
ncbi:hypothetical protein PIB30_095754 [Stylosanthes scabra]|uniref:Uncharacterized protein n=1 Tax=Stylosanthes scabra TaxID=79078 RepID=A0ABU6VUI3_9FABA|nr:hypothetical protein [Stylosanthes scabra]